VAVAAWIFWPRGGGRQGVVLDDQIPLVTADSSATAAPPPAQPRSSDVNLGLEVKPIVPEKPASSAPETPQNKPADTVGSNGDGSGSPGAATTGKTTPGRNAAPAAERPVLSPGPAGKWAIQVGAFGSRANADKLATGLRARGLRVETCRGNLAGGTAWKVWIGYFPTREETVRWLRKHRDEVGMATYITHR